MRVEQLMSREVVCCHVDDNLEIVAGQMWEADVGALPVVDREGRVLSMITDREVAKAAYRGSPYLQSVGELVHAPADPLHIHDPVSKAEAILSGGRARWVPVVDAEGRLCGVVGRNALRRSAAAVPPAP